MLRADMMRPPEPAPCRQCDILVPGSETGRDISITDHSEIFRCHLVHTFFVRATLAHRQIRASPAGLALGAGRRAAVAGGAGPGPASEGVSRREAGVLVLGL